MQTSLTPARPFHIAILLSRTLGLAVAIGAAASFIACGGDGGESDDGGDTGDTGDGGDGGDGEAPDGGISATCGPDTCDGCCSGDTCLAGDSIASCGEGGDQCTDCGASFSCEVGSCQVVPGSTWDLKVLSAHVSETNTEGEEWDVDIGGSRPDVYASIIAGSEPNQMSARTGTLDDTTSPLWNETILEDVAAERLLDQLFVVVKDSDFGGDQLVGQCAAEVDSSSFVPGANVFIDCPRDVGEQQAGFDLRLELIPH